MINHLCFQFDWHRQKVAGVFTSWRMRADSKYSVLLPGGAGDGGTALFSGFSLLGWGTIARPTACDPFIGKRIDFDLHHANEE